MTVPQHMQALAKANAVRMTNVATCRRIAAMTHLDGRREVARLLVEDESDVFGRMKVEQLISSVRKFGPQSARVAMRCIDVKNLGKRVGDLTPRQRVALADLMGREAPIANWGQRTERAA